MVNSVVQFRRLALTLTFNRKGRKMETKYYSVSLCLSIEADTEQEALTKFDEMVQKGQYDSGSVDVEFEMETT